MSCCPEDSLPYLKSDTANIGTQRSHGKCEFYEVGNSSSGKAVLVLSDVWGWQSGRVRALADHFSIALESLAVIPKLLSEPAFEGGTNGDALPPDFDMTGRRGEFAYWMKTSHPFSTQEPTLRKMMSYLDSKGITKIYMIGVCWGAYCAFKLGGEEDLRGKCVAIATPHPSVGAAKGIFGEETLDVVKACPIPALLMPAGNDPDDYRPGGDIFVNAAKGSEVVDFPAMQHGFFTRGDASHEAVAEDVQRAVEAIAGFFKKF